MSQCNSILRSGRPVNLNSLERLAETLVEERRSPHINVGTPHATITGCAVSLLRGGHKLSTSNIGPTILGQRSIRHTHFIMAAQVQLNVLWGNFTMISYQLLVQYLRGRQGKDSHTSWNGKSC